MGNQFKHDEFSLRFAADGERMRLSVVGSSQGEASAELVPPCTADELGALRRRWQEAILAPPARTSRFTMAPWAESRLAEELQALGDRLYRCAFPEGIRRLWDAARGHASGRGAAGVALRLAFDAREPRTAFLAALPWELIACSTPGRHRALSLDAATPVYRYLEVPEPPRPIDLRPPLGVLLVAAAPRDQPELALGRERDAIRRRWEEEPCVTVEALAPATFAAFREALAGGRFQIVHFLGHGVFDERCGRGALVFEDADGRSSLVSDEAVAAQFRGRDEVALVVVNACEGACSPTAPAHPTVAGVAACLIDEGVPAVVAMQFPIGDRAAGAFGAGLHRGLARGDGLLRAVAAGRAEILAEVPGSPQWVTPALFLRSHTSQARRADGAAAAERAGNTVEARTIETKVFVGGHTVYGAGRGPAEGTGRGGGDHIAIDRLKADRVVLAREVYEPARDDD